MKDIKFKISHALELLTGLIGWDARRFLVQNVYHFMTYVLFILMMTHLAAFFSFDVVEAMMNQAWLKVLVKCCHPQKSPLSNCVRLRRIMFLARSKEKQ